MKFAIIVLLAFIAAVSAGSVKVNDNHIGNIVTVDVNADAVISNNMQQNMLTMLLAALNQQVALAAAAGSNQEAAVDTQANDAP